MKNKPKDTLYCGVSEDKIKTSSPEIDKTVLQYLHEFIHDRYEIHKRKDVDKLPAPWTDNEIFQNVKFTNVRREHDRQSKNLIEHICKQTQYDLMTRCFNIIMFRCWNKYESWSKLNDGKLVQFPVTESYKQQLIQNVKDAIVRDPDHRWYSAAYNTGPIRNWHLKRIEITGEEKPFYSASPVFFANIQLTVEFWDEITKAKTPQELMTVFKTMPYMGGTFISYQLFVDFTYNEDFWFSENEFTVSGPGCSRGLDHIFKDKDGMTDEECLFWLRDNLAKLFEESNLPYDPQDLYSDLPEYDRVTNVMSIENLMCELSKYVKCKEALKLGKTPRGKCSYPGTSTTSKVSKKDEQKTYNLFDIG